MHKNQFKLICFDVDGTLVDGTSWFLLTKGLDCSVKKHQKIYQLAIGGKISFIEGERKLTRMYRGSGKANEFFIKKLFSKIEPKSEAKIVIEYLKKKGYLIYLISGAIDIYVEEIAKKLGVNGFYANSTLEFGSGGVLEKIHYRDNQNGVKVKQLEELINKLSLKMNEVVFVGDSENDLGVFEKTGHGIAINSSCGDLKRTAWKRGDSLNKIRNFL